MNYELFTVLKSDFPEMFTELKEIQCENGWFDLIYELTNTIYEYYKLNMKSKFPTVVQIKEKFGGLRYYIEREDNDMIVTGMIWFAESLSFKTCEKCGSKGTLIKEKSYKTLCKKCLEGE